MKRPEDQQRRSSATEDIKKEAQQDMEHGQSCSIVKTHTPV